MIASTFAGFSEQEALLELSSTDGNAGPNVAPFPTPPLLRAFGGRLAGWISTCPSDHRGPCKQGTAIAAKNSASQRTDAPCSPAVTAGDPLVKKYTTAVQGAVPHTAATEGSCNDNREDPSPRTRSSHHNISGFRELTASRLVRRGDIVAVERPFAALQTSEAMPWVVTCPGCLRHVGSLDVQLAIASGAVGRAGAFASCSRTVGEPLPQPSLLPQQQQQQQQSAKVVEEPVDCSGVSVDGLPLIAGLSERFTQSPVPCSGGCGAVYCSDVCRSRCWDLGHSLLCLGLADNEDHPLVRHKLHAVTHPDLEAPLLLASQLLVQVALTVALKRLTDNPASWGYEDHHAASAIPSAARTPVVTAADAPDPGSRQIGVRIGEIGGGESCEGSRSRPTVTSSVSPRASPPFADGVTTIDGCCCGRGEVGAVRTLTEALFPRGRFREGSGRAPPVAAVQESRALLVEALAIAARERKEGRNRAGGDVRGVVDPVEFPLLLGERVHADVVGSLAANLLDVEVRSPLVEYCEALVTRDRSVQRRALQVLEPVLREMDVDEDSDGDGDQSQLSERSSSKPAVADFEELPCEIPAAKRCDINDPDGRDRPETLAENRASARLAWRCLYTARIAARVIPPLSARALLPAVALRLSHSCAPAVKVPAGDPRLYRNDGGDRGGTAGLPGWPLSVAVVALRDVSTDDPLTCSWVDAGERFSVRMARLWEYDGVTTATAAAVMTTPLECEAERHDGGSLAGASLDADIPRGSLCDCCKCRVEGAAEERDESVAPGVAPIGIEELLESARLATDEDRLDDAADALRRAAQLSPLDGDVLYRAGVCAINQGRWSRAVRLWREGLMLSPDNSQLKHEAERYRALAFWLDSPHDSGAECQDIRPFSHPNPLPPPLPMASTSPGNHRHRYRDRACGLADSLDVTFMAGPGEWVSETRGPPPLSRSECALVIQEAEETAASSRNGWGTARHYAVPTTDIAVRDLPRTLAWFNTAMRDRIAPLVAAAAALGAGEAFGVCAKEDEDEDITGLEEEEEEELGAFVARLRVHDAFVVRYDAAAQRSLPLHTDQGELSLTISLNSGDEYEGGGTWFHGLGRAVRPADPGHVVIFPGGEAVHGGCAITSGIRYILAVFLYEHHREEEEEGEEEEEEENNKVEEVGEGGGD